MSKAVQRANVLRSENAPCVLRPYREEDGALAAATDAGVLIHYIRRHYFTMSRTLQYYKIVRDAATGIKGPTVRIVRDSQVPDSCSLPDLIFRR